MTSHDKWVGEIPRYGNVERLENLLDEWKTFHEHQKEEDAACDDSIDLSDLHDKPVVYDENG